MNKITTNIGIMGVSEEVGTPEIRDAGDIVEILDHPNEGMSTLFIAVQGGNECDYCYLCDIPYKFGSMYKLCMFTKFRCTATSTGVYLKRIDTVLDNL